MKLPGDLVVITVTENASNETQASANICSLSYNINLAVKETIDINVVSKILGKTNKLVTYFNKSPTAMRILFKKQNDFFLTSTN